MDWTVNIVNYFPHICTCGIDLHFITFYNIQEDISSFSKSSIVDVHSPQYNTIFSYHLLFNKNTDNDNAPLVKLIARNKSQTPNSFIERTLILAFSYILVSKTITSELPPILGIQLRADNDFYSQVDTLKSMNLSPPTPKDVESLPPFLPAGEHKTGMGSSAALVTSLVASLLYYFFDQKDELLIHNLAQTAHSLAQGKIGSGFDVSAAVYGSQIYSRFSQALIQPLLQEFSSDQNTGTSSYLTVQFANQLHQCVHASWDTTQKPFTLPQGLEIIMADVCGGSESPSMARKVLQWHKSYQQTKDKDGNNNNNDNEDGGDDDDDYWEGLRKINLELYNLFTELQTKMNAMDSQEIQKTLHVLSTTSADQWQEANNASSELSSQIAAIREAFFESRSLLKAMGEVANVPVEPDEQTSLADATMDIPGVIAAGVPGAGGFDALFSLYIKGETTEKSDSVRDSIAKLWGEWKGDEESSKNDEETIVSAMGVRAVAWGEGLQVESEMEW